MQLVMLRGKNRNQALHIFSRCMLMTAALERGPSAVAGVPKEACHLFLYCPPAKHSFSFLHGSSLGRRVEKYLKFTFVSGRKALWELGHIHSFSYCSWLFSCYKGRIEELQRTPYGPKRPEHVLFGLSWRSFPTVLYRDVVIAFTECFFPYC